MILNRALLVASAAALLLFLVLPVAALLAEAFTDASFLDTVAQDAVTDALLLSLVTTAITLAITVLFGTPAAYLLARYRFRGADIVDTVVDLPIVLPPAVAGIALLFTFGRVGLIGDPLDEAGIQIAFTTTAVVMAQLFVAAPFYVKAAKAGFESVDPGLERVSATLGESAPRTFLRVTVPLAAPALLGGAVMTWARALGEFGATIMFAGSLAGSTRTVPLAIYDSLQSDLDVALVLGAILVVIAFAVLLAFKLVVGRSPLLAGTGGEARA